MTAAGSSGVAVVLAVKPTLGAKQRLAARLDGEQRRLLALAMAGDALRTVTAVAGRARVVVVGGDPAVADLAARHGVAHLPETGSGQSAAVAIGERWAMENGFRRVATVAADCALAEGDDVERLLSSIARSRRLLVCVPDAEGTGTNAAAVTPLGEEPWRFGPDSLRRHAAVAAALDLRFRRLDLPSLRVDCDRPADLDVILATPRPTATFHLLRHLGLAEPARARA